LTHPLGHAIANMLTLGFFFLLRPGEYAHTDNPDSAPFQLVDVHLMVGCRRLPHRTCPLHELHTATFACLEFTTQKNGVRGEMIGLGRSGNAAFCPIAAIINRVVHLRQAGLRPTLLSTPTTTFVGFQSLQPSSPPAYDSQPPPSVRP
jgi:hypothetical protein